MEPQFRIVEVHHTRRIALVCRKCPVCGNTFRGVRQRRYCSTRCRSRAEVQRNGTARLARQLHPQPHLKLPRKRKNHHQ